MDAFRDHGRVRADPIEQHVDGGRADHGDARRAGHLDLDAMTDELVEDGVKQFADASDTLLAAVERKRRG